jgi:hypothetical protein
MQAILSKHLNIINNNYINGSLIFDFANIKESDLFFCFMNLYIILYNILNICIIKQIVLKYS